MFGVYIVETFFTPLIKRTNRIFGPSQQAHKTTVPGVIEFYTKWSRFQLKYKSAREPCSSPLCYV